MTRPRDLIPVDPNAPRDTLLEIGRELHDRLTVDRLTTALDHPGEPESDLSES